MTVGCVKAENSRRRRRWIRYTNHEQQSATASRRGGGARRRLRASWAGNDWTDLKVRAFSINRGSVDRGPANVPLCNMMLKPELEAVLLASQGAIPGSTKIQIGSTQATDGLRSTGRSWCCWVHTTTRAPTFCLGPTGSAPRCVQLARARRLPLGAPSP